MSAPAAATPRMSASTIPGDETRMSWPTAIRRGWKTSTNARPVASHALVPGSVPGVLCRRVQTFFARASLCVMTVGEIVGKFAGAALMAAFGLPQAHEDDA